MRVLFFVTICLLAALVPTLAFDSKSQHAGNPEAEHVISSLLEANAEADKDVAEAVDMLSAKDMELHPLEDAAELNDVEAETNALIQADSALMDPQEALQLQPFDNLALLETQESAKLLQQAHAELLDHMEAQAHADAEGEADADAEGEASTEVDSEVDAQAQLDSDEVVHKRVGEDGKTYVKHQVVEDGILNAYPIEGPDPASYLETAVEVSSKPVDFSKKISVGKRKNVHIHVKAPGRKLGLKAEHLGRALHQMTSMHNEVVGQLTDVLGKLKFLKRHKPCNKMSLHPGANNDVRAWAREVAHVTTLLTERQQKK